MQEYDAGVRGYGYARRSSTSISPNGVAGAGVNGAVTAADNPVETPRSVRRLDLEFGYCKLQVQVPKKGPYVTSKDLAGKTIGMSFPHLATELFARLEAGVEGASLEDMPKKLKTKIIELSGSVEAACALGVADAIVDLVGKHGRCFCLAP